MIRKWWVESEAAGLSRWEAFGMMVGWLDLVWVIVGLAAAYGVAGYQRVGEVEV